MLYLYKQEKKSINVSLIIKCGLKHKIRTLQGVYFLHHTKGPKNCLNFSIKGAAEKARNTLEFKQTVWFLGGLEGW